MQHYVLQCVCSRLFRRQPCHVNVSKAVVSKRRGPRLPTVGTDILVVLDVLPFVIIANKIAHDVVFVEPAVDYRFAEVKSDFLSAHAVYAQAYRTGIVLAEIVDIAVARRDHACGTKPPLFSYRLDVALAEFAARSFDDNRFAVPRQRLVRRLKQLGAIISRVVAFACAYVVKRNCRVVRFKRRIRFQR